MQISKLFSAVCAFAVCAGVVTVRADDNPAQAAARAALFSKMSDLGSSDSQPQTNNVIVTAAGVKMVKPSPSMQPASPAKTMAVSAQPTMATQPVVAGPGDNPAQAAARKALFEKLGGIQEAQPAVAAPVQASAPAKPPVMAQTTPAAVASAEPVPATKEQKLQDLLAKYKADQITAAEYHRQRALLINEP